MTDNIMPLGYFGTLIPRLQGLDQPMHIFYEQKANLTLERVVGLREAGVAVIQPGIESLSTSLLKKMKKGVSAAQNIALLRYCRSTGLAVNWNILYGFPGDVEAEYLDTIRILPSLRHLHPPTGVSHLSIDRFSPYFDRPAEYGISGVQPMDSYFSVLPQDAEVDNIAYHFIGEYDCADRRDPSLADRIKAEVEAWRGAWTVEDVAAPVLAVEKISDELFMLLDTRGDDRARKVSFIDRARARLALIPNEQRWSSVDSTNWARSSGVALDLEGSLVPLATARPDLIAELSRDRTADLGSFTPPKGVDAEGSGSAPDVMSVDASAVEVSGIAN